MPSMFIVFAVFIIVAWFPVVWMQSRLGGWYELSCHYLFTGEAPAARRHVFAGSVGGVQMRNILQVAALPEGLFLSVLVFFRPGHPPLLIPWQAVTEVYRRETMKSDLLRLVVRIPDKPKTIQITLPARHLESVMQQLPPAQPDKAGPHVPWPLMIGLIAVVLIVFGTMVTTLGIF